MLSPPDLAGHTQGSTGDPQESNTCPPLKLWSKLGLFIMNLNFNEASFLKSKKNQSSSHSLLYDYDNVNQMLEPSLATALSQLMLVLRPVRISCKCVLLVFVVWTNLFLPGTEKFDLGASLRMSLEMVAADLRDPPAHTRQGGAPRES